MKIFLLLFLFSVALSAQENEEQKALDKKIYELNNEFKYEESQDILTAILDDNDASDSNKYFASILLSNTYKRVFDYSSTLLYLKKAYTHASSQKDSITLASLEAMVYFDTHDYEKTETIMTRIEGLGYKGLKQEEKSILVMQQGYLCFLKKENAKALTYYKRALKIMDDSGSCNQPIVLGKMIALYDTKSTIKTRDSLYHEGIKKANDCHILKYEIYLTNELIKILNPQWGDNLNHYKQHLLSLEKKYDAETHEYKMRYSATKKLENELENKSESNYIFLISVILLIVLLICIILLAINGYKKRKKIEFEYVEIKAKLDTFLENLTENQQAKINDLEKTDVFTERQREILKLLKNGKMNKEISEVLHISENTVKYHVKNVYKILEDNGVSFKRESVIAIKE